MQHDDTRRTFLGVMGAAALAGAATQATGQPAERPAAGKVKVLAVSCSPRKGKTTAAALTAALEAAAKSGPDVETELVELAGLNIPVFVPGAKDAGDFPKIAEKLGDPAVRGLIIGTPVYFGSPTSLCKAFLDHCSVFRANAFALGGKVAGVVAVGGVRNGGQELTIQCVQAALMCQQMVVVGDGKPTAHTGATLVNDGKDDISGDAFGLSTARNLGRHVAEVALALRR